jgi:hypothetical protein
MLLTYFLNNFEMVPVAPIITGISLVFTFHMRCISIVRSLYFKIFSASFLITFLSHYYYYYYFERRDSSVGIATRYGLDVPGIEPRWGRDFPHPSRPALGPPSLLYNGYRVFPWGKGAGAWR